MNKIFKQAREASEAVSQQTKLRPTLALVLGSGLSAFARELTSAQALPYDEIPHFPSSTVTGHAGRMVIGKFAGTTLLVMSGRVHA